jgi:hypothetical protein
MNKVQKPSNPKSNISSELLRIDLTNFVRTTFLDLSYKVCIEQLRGLHHTLSTQNDGRKVLCVQQGFRYGNFCSHCMLKRTSSKFLMITLQSTSLFDENPPSNMFYLNQNVKHQYLILSS